MKACATEDDTKSPTTCANSLGTLGILDMISNIFIFYYYILEYSLYNYEYSYSLY